MKRKVFKIISGGQTGADRAALDWAIEHGVPHRGWCPKGRLAEDGPIDPRYQMKETPSSSYAQRTTNHAAEDSGKRLDSPVFSDWMRFLPTTGLIINFAAQL